ncbi:MAG: phosphoenolpyruvate-utilizing N-terminal domain-containing protein, partial [Pseudomonadota bacterium]|nr:phosphoenolpyruvate-utilizing N-terminal domain-containing protein [Pseudomonadota bacterium]
MTLILKGIAVSKGISIGKTYIFKKGQPSVEEKIVKKNQIQKERKRFDSATKKTLEQFEFIKQSVNPSIKKNAAMFLDTHIFLIKDKTFINNIRKSIRNKNCSADWAVYSEFLKIQKSFENIEDPYIKQRIEDIRHVVLKILENINSNEIKPQKIFKYFKKRIIVCDDLTPTDVLIMHESKGLGLISEFGGPSSHSSILTRSLEMPAIVGVKNAQIIVKDGDTLILDGNEGNLIINPDKKSLMHYKGLQQKNLKKKRLMSTILKKDNVTLDGKKIEIMINLELPQEL